MFFPSALVQPPFLQRIFNEGSGGSNVKRKPEADVANIMEAGKK